LLLADLISIATSTQGSLALQAVPEDGEAVVKEPDVKSIVPKSSSGSLNFCGRASRRR
jgi:hypothetical protein